MASKSHLKYPFICLLAVYSSCQWVRLAEGFRSVRCVSWTTTIKSRVSVRSSKYRTKAQRSSAFPDVFICQSLLRVTIICNMPWLNSRKLQLESSVWFHLPRGSPIHTASSMIRKVLVYLLLCRNSRIFRKLLCQIRAGDFQCFCEAVFAVLKQFRDIDDSSFCKFPHTQPIVSESTLFKAIYDTF
ncbi:hypothetical protein BJ741DRAFT_592861 [Chytriomyces cf. hyalinus JEL632]|nr:hypothetical protein BJ741DRAFT_592861 [Chytriomyces cf. hyalinus JEL632]